MFRKQITTPPDTPHYHIKTHGGLGDIVWVEKKLSHLPLFISISEENRQRPRRSGFLVDHFPNVVGWRFDSQTFVESGDWPPHTHPACAIDKRWSDLAFKMNTLEPYRLECNRHLEGGRRIEDWLPDLPTTHHFPFTHIEPSTLTVPDPSVIVHIAGWPDIANSVWAGVIRALSCVATVFLVAGSYESRAQTVYAETKSPEVRMMLDLSWPDLVGLIKKCRFCFGHASGLTALADLFRVPGAVVNPHYHPLLNKTWNSSEFEGAVHVTSARDFQAAVGAARATLMTDAVWPPMLLRATALDRVPAPEFVRAAIKARRPTTILLVDGDAAQVTEAVSAAYDEGILLRAISIVGGTAETAAEQAHQLGARVSRPPVVLRYDRMRDLPQYGTYDMIVSWGEQADHDTIDRLWGLTAASGLLAIGGKAGRSASQVLAGRCRDRVRTTESGWAYIYRGV